MRRLVLAFFALISSCGPAPEGPPDTVDVGPGTRAERPASPVATPTAPHPDAPSPPPPAVTHDRAVPNLHDATLVGFAGSRFAIVDTAASTLVFDAETASAFVVHGHALHTETSDWDIWANANFQGDVLGSRVVASADGLRLLVRTEGGVQVVDLGSGGALLTGLRTADVRGASLAPDGETFAAWTDSDLTIVRVADGARVAYPVAAGHAPLLQWTARSVAWTDDARARIVDRASWRVQTTEGAESVVTLSHDGAVAVVAQPALVEVWRSGEARPAAHLATHHVTNLVVDEPGRNVAWVEYSGEYDAKSVLHTVETESGAHHHFAGQAERCQLTHEYLLGIENGELRTDGECGPGCPSATRQSEFRTYDVKTGKVTKQWNGDVERPFNEGIGARSAIGENLARIFGLAIGTTLPIKHHPSADVVLVERPDALRSGETPDAPREVANPRRLGIALRLADHRTGGAGATLERSAEFSVETAHFWPASGARVVGVGRDEVVVWDSASGKRVWASRH